VAKKAVQAEAADDVVGITDAMNELLKWPVPDFLDVIAGGKNLSAERVAKIRPAHLLAAARFAAACDPASRNGNGAAQLIVDRVEGAVAQEQHITIRVEGVADNARREREAKQVKQPARPMLVGRT
jgi:hypothetical protein